MRAMKRFPFLCVVSTVAQVKKQFGGAGRLSHAFSPCVQPAHIPSARPRLAGGCLCPEPANTLTSVSTSWTNSSGGPDSLVGPGLRVECSLQDRTCILFYLRGLSLSRILVTWGYRSEFRSTLKSVYLNLEYKLKRSLVLTPFLRTCRLRCFNNSPGAILWLSQSGGINFQGW